MRSDTGLARARRLGDAGAPGLRTPQQRSCNQQIVSLRELPWSRPGGSRGNSRYMSAANNQITWHLIFTTGFTHSGKSAAFYVWWNRRPSARVRHAFETPSYGPDFELLYSSGAEPIRLLMLILEILCGWFALSGIAAFFVYCCSRVSEDRRPSDAPEPSVDEVLESDTPGCGTQSAAAPATANR